MKEYKAGIIGTGFIGKQHIEAVSRIPGVSVKAISDINEEAGRAVQQEYAIPDFYRDYKDMLKDPEIDVIHNCTPTYMHDPVNRECILSGKHIYCEKPLTLKASQAEELVSLAGEKGVCGAVNFNYRNNVMVHEMKARIENGKIGTPFLIYGEYLQDWLLYDTDYDWRMDPMMGGESRAAVDIGSHCLDTMEYILGRKVISVYARLINLYPVRKKPAVSKGTFSQSENHSKGESSKENIFTSIAVDSEDAAFIMLEFEGGIHGLLYLSQVCAGRKNGMSISVSGTKASMKWDQERMDHLWIGHRDRGNEDIYASPELLEEKARVLASLPAGHSVGWADAFRNGIYDFYTHLGIEKSDYGYACLTDGWRTMEIVEACLKSSRENRWVEVRDISTLYPHV
ncbi:MAG: Gfo/Idh/MocA family oxidoreductase [Eubacteriales bacterium]|nr:Gfo/Idh/MocA family oxidoreductase [Eubacteriales bacterium]